MTSKEEISNLKSGKYVIGQIRVGLGYKAKIHWIVSPFLSQDILVRSLNKGFHGSVVIVELNPKSMWVPRPEYTGLRHQQGLINSSKTYDEIVGGDQPHMIMCKDLQPTGYIVRIHSTPKTILQSTFFIRSDMPKDLSPDDIHTWSTIGNRESMYSLEGHYYSFVTLDPKYPLIFILKSNVSKDVSDKFFTHYIEIEVDVNWVKGNSPTGKISKVLHPINTIEEEHIKMLDRENFASKILSDDLIDFKSLSDNIRGWKCAENNTFIQQDGTIRHSVVGVDNMITIDPEGAQDLDDGLSVRVLENGLLSVGVHIADVSHFVEEGTEIDLNARERQSSIYMIGKCIPMLPKHLSNQICSLVPGSNKLGLSCYWVIDYNKSIEQNKLVVVGEPTFKKTIVESVCKLSYPQALRIMNDDDTEKDWVDFHGDKHLFSKDGVKYSLLILKHLHEIIRLNRPQWVELSEDNCSLNFDRLNGSAKSVKITDANKMVETWMVEANCAAAQYQQHNAIIRKHEGFSKSRSEHLADSLACIGINLSVKNKESYMQCISAMPKRIKTKIKDTLKYSFDKAMYSISQSNGYEGHFGLGVDKYTHFTSPIRRYPDIMVHRNISAILRKTETLSTLTTKDINSILVKANIIKSKIDKIGRKSQSIHLNKWLQSLPRPIDCIGTVINIRTKNSKICMQISLDNPCAIIEDFIIPNGEISNMYIPNIQHFKYSGKTHTAIAKWKDGKRRKINILTKFKVKLVHCSLHNRVTTIVIISQE
jgi:exoribonuclease R